MLIDFQLEQQKKFDALARRILDNLQAYLSFDSIADFYAAPWLQQFPRGTVWTASGLDDGAEEYCILIQYQVQHLRIDYGPQLAAALLDRQGVRHHCLFKKRP